MTFLRTCMIAVCVLQFSVSLEAAKPVLLKVHDVNDVQGETDAGEEVTENSGVQSANDGEESSDDDEEVAAVQDSLAEDTKVADEKDEYDTPAEQEADLKSAEKEYLEDQAEKKRRHDSGEEAEEEKEKFEQDKQDAKEAAAQEVEAEAEQKGGVASPADIAKAEKAAVAEIVADHAEVVAMAKDDAETAKRDALNPPAKFDFDSLVKTLQGTDGAAAPTKAAVVLKVKTVAKPVTAVKAKVVTKALTGVKAKAHSKPKSVAKAKKMAKVNAAVKPVVLAKANKVAANVKVAVKTSDKKKGAAFMHVKHSDDDIDGDAALGKMFEEVKKEATVATDTATSDVANDGESADDESMVPSGEGVVDAAALPIDEDAEPALLQTAHADADDTETDEEETDTVDDDSEDEASDDAASSETKTTAADDSEDESSNDDASSEFEKQDAAIEAASDASEVEDIDELTGVSTQEDA